MNQLRALRRACAETPAVANDALPVMQLHTAMQDALPAAVCTAESLAEQTPPYTVYPPANYFVTTFGAENYARHLALRELGHAVPLSVFLHIPLCSQLCHYRGCNNENTPDYKTVRLYVTHLLHELALINECLGDERDLAQMHWGGGIPAILQIADISRLMGALLQCFNFNTKGDYSIEIDACMVDHAKLIALKNLGFTHLSLAVQDFEISDKRVSDPFQLTEKVVEVLHCARLLDFQSTQVDLVYDLPGQTASRFRKTIELMVDLRPERIALYSYAHMPLRFKMQKQINHNDMPTQDEKQAIVELANEQLDVAGYEYIGMDQYALPDDALAIACRAGRLHRDLYGYTSKPDCDLIALGASAISRVGNCYSQNAIEIDEYAGLLSQGILPAWRGIELSRDDLLRRALIMAILCQGEIDKHAVEIAYLINFDKYFHSELKQLELWHSSGYVQLSAQFIVVTAAGRRKALHLIAAVFDRYVNSG